VTTTYLGDTPLGRILAMAADTNPDHRCGLCKWAKWADQRPGYWADIRGRCGHPRASATPCPEPLAVRLQGGLTCRFWASGGDEPKRRME
jgi:hypothetical protein